MNEEIQYNLAINDLKNRKIWIERELNEKIKELDKVRAEIRDQREAKTVVYHEQVTLEQIRYFLDEQTKVLADLREKDHTNFTEIVSKNRAMIQKMESDIEKSKKLIEKYKSSQKEISDLEIKKQKLIDNIVGKRKEFWEISEDIDKKKREIDEKIEQYKILQKEVVVWKEQIKKEQDSQEKTKKRLELYEKRLDDLKNSLIKKYGKNNIFNNSEGIE